MELPVSADSVFICIKITYSVRVRRPRQATAPTHSKNACPSGPTAPPSEKSLDPPSALNKCLLRRDHDRPRQYADAGHPHLQILRHIGQEAVCRLRPLGHGHSIRSRTTNPVKRLITFAATCTLIVEETFKFGLTTKRIVSLFTLYCITYIALYVCYDS